MVFSYRSREIKGRDKKGTSSSQRLSYLKKLRADAGQQLFGLGVVSNYAEAACESFALDTARLAADQQTRTDRTKRVPFV